AHAPLADEAEPTSAPLAPPTASPSAAPAPLTPRSADPRPSADDRE
ncbi:MAG TPA: molecular chaperone DnaJ, partial [Rhodospirillum rubrum]|nr:molecular chaperone DnaJ [Rhodospirillum rubrum]